jgi:hypothetical protein
VDGGSLNTSRVYCQGGKRLALRVRADHIEATGIADKLAGHAVDNAWQHAEGAVAMLPLIASDTEIAADGEIERTAGDRCAPSSRCDGD